MATLNYVWSILAVAFGLGFLIFWHELGHFLLAKWNNVKVEKFSVGFGPSLDREWIKRQAAGLHSSGLPFWPRSRGRDQVPGQSAMFRRPDEILTNQVWKEQR